MKVLSIEQMTRLKQLGVDVEPNGLGFMYSSVVLDEYRLMYAESVCEDDMKAFGLQDVIELIPSKIKIEESDYLLKIYTSSSRFSYEIISDPLCGDYDPFEEIVFRSNNILDAAYQMLIWVIENNYLKTK